MTGEVNLLDWITSYWKKKAIVLAGISIGFSFLSSLPAHAASPWVFQEDGWHYYMENGQPGIGWVESNGFSYYLLPDGKSITDTITPDGYYVNADGAWYRRQEEILGISFTSFDRFLPVGGEWDKSPSILLLSEKYRQIFGQTRRIRVAKDRIEYIVSGDGSAKSSSLGSSMFTGNQNTANKNGSASDTGTPLAVLYQEPGQGRYCLELKMKLHPKSTDEKQTATYDYALFKALMYQISSTPDILEEALLDAWQGENRWQINRQDWVRAGDAMILYAPGKEAGRFFIRPAAEGD